jgi:hypothetical protein
LPTPDYRRIARSRRVQQNLLSEWKTPRRYLLRSGSALASPNASQSRFGRVKSLTNRGKVNCSEREEITMKRWPVVTLALLIGFAIFRFSHEASGQAGAPWITLFDGSSLDNWKQTGDANWKLADGIVAADKGNGFLVSKDSYGDFQIRAEFWVTSETNSGIFLRCATPEKPTAKDCYEVNIWDTRPDPTYGTGAIVDVAKVSPMPKAGGQWNTYEITAKGPQLTVILNGARTVDVQDSKHARGPIALQYGAGIVKFRKVELKPL